MGKKGCEYNKKCLYEVAVSCKKNFTENLSKLNFLSFIINGGIQFKWTVNCMGTKILGFVDL